MASEAPDEPKHVEVEEEEEEETSEMPASSRLGTLEYWDALYARERANFAACPDDVGEVWFGESCLHKVCRCVARLPGIDPATARVLDVGCGNAYTLVWLWCEHGFRHVVGTDYSPNSVAHARAVLAAQCPTEGLAPDTFEQSVVLDDATDTKLAPASFDVVLDKGTYDAIYLMPGTQEERDAALKRYRDCAARVLKEGEKHYFVITTCNFTRAEIERQFADTFDYHSHLDYPVLEFGGHKGSTNATVVFVHKKK